MNLLHLRYFVELASTCHYTRAAERLCITQPSLSHAIAQLEAELGVPLFQRNGRTTTLTRFGEQFLACAQQTLSTLDDGVETLQRVARGEGLIRLGLLRTLGTDFVPRLAARFLAANSGKDIHFTFNTASAGRAGEPAVRPGVLLPAAGRTQTDGRSGEPAGFGSDRTPVPPSGQPAYGGSDGYSALPAGLFLQEVRDAEHCGRPLSPDRWHTADRV